MKFKRMKLYIKFALTILNATIESRLYLRTKPKNNDTVLKNVHVTTVSEA